MRPRPRRRSRIVAFLAAAIAIPGAALAQLDADGDGIPDATDTCPRVANLDQTNSDALRAGDACQCGDVDGSNVVDLADVVLIERHAAGEVIGAAFDVDRCAVERGPLGCGSDDALALRFYLAGIAAQATNACAAAGVEPDPDANDDGSVNALDGSIVGFCAGQDLDAVCGCRRADIDRDGDVDTDDLGLVSQLFGQSGFPIAPPITGTPEIVSVQPADGSPVAATPLRVEVTTAAPADPVLINGVTATLVAAEALRYAADVPLVEGANAIEILATGADCSLAVAQIALTLDLTPPVVAITDPLDGASFIDGAISVSGTVDDAEAEVAVNGVTAAVDGSTWTATGVPLAVGPNTLTATATDPAGNPAAPDSVDVTRDVQLVRIELSPSGRRLTSLGAQQAYTVTGHLSDGTTLDLTDPATGTTYASTRTYVATVDGTGLATAQGSGETGISARNGGLEASATLKVELDVALESIQVTPRQTTLFGSGASQQLLVTGAFDDGTIRDLTPAATGTTYVSSHPEIARVGPDGRVEAVASGATTIDVFNEDRADAAGIDVVVSTGRGFVRGRVIDDATGLPLSGATATLLVDGTGPVPAPAPVPTTGDGRYLLPAASGPSLVRVERAGYTPVERRGEAPADTALRLLDARPTPLDPQLTQISSAGGGSARSSDPAVRLDLFGGSLESTTGLRLTRISPQGLIAHLPQGWSPLAAVDVAPRDLAFAQPGLLHVPHTGMLPGGAAVVAALYDETQHAWIAIDPGQVTADRAEVVTFVPGSGQIALLVADSGAGAPPAPVTGAPLAGVGEVAVPDDAGARSDVRPPSAPAGPAARAVAELLLLDTPDHPSGSRVEADVLETFDLLDGRVLLPQPFAQDLLLFGRPRLAEDAVLGARFPIAPSRQLTIHELSIGRVQLAVSGPRPRISGAVVGADGALLVDGGARLDVPAGALSTEWIADLREVPPAEVIGPVPEGYALLGAAAVDLVGRPLDLPAALSITRPPGVLPEEQVLVARRIRDPDGAPHLKMVALGVLGPGRITTSTALPGAALPGVDGEGDYLFLVPPAPLGFLTGQVLVPGGGGRQPRALVTTDTAAFADVTGGDGTYLVAAVPGDASIGVLLQETGDAAAAVAVVGGAGSVATFDLTLEIVGPTVVASSPRGGATGVPLDTAVEVLFSEPVAAASVTPASFTLTGPAGPIPASIRVAPDGRSAILTPVAPLASNTAHDVALTAAVTDVAGNPLAPFGPASFRTLDTSFVRDITGLIEADAPDAGGIITVRGGPGVAEAGSAIAVINQTTGVIVTEVAQPDGSFELRIAGTTADLLTLNVRTAGGTDTEVQVGQFNNADGSVTLGELGGEVVVDGPGGPYTLGVAPGVFPGRATIRMEPLTEAETLAELAALGLELPDPSSGAVFGGAMRLQVTGARPEGRLDFRAPLLPEVAQLAVDAGRLPEDIQGTLVVVDEQTAQEGEVLRGFREIDSFEVVDGQLDTNSFIFQDSQGIPGIGGIFSSVGLIVFFPFPQFSTAYLTGRALIVDDPSNPNNLQAIPGTVCPPPDAGDASIQICPAPGAIVRSFTALSSGIPLFYAVARTDGHFEATVPGASLPGENSAGVSASRPDAHPAVKSVAFTGPFASIGDVIMRRRPPPPDTTPPIVSVTVSTNPVAAGQPVTFTGQVSDNDNSASNVTQIRSSLMLRTVSGPGPGPPPSFQEGADGRLTAAWTPVVPGTYQLAAQATDQSGNTGGFSLVVQVGDFPPPPGDSLPVGDPADTIPPFVTSVDPPDFAVGVATDAVVRLEFSEPVQRSIEGVGGDGLPFFVEINGPEGPLAASLTLSADQTVLEIRPAGGLRPGATYFVTAQTQIVDLNGTNLDQLAETGNLSEPFFSQFEVLGSGDLNEITGLGFNIRAGRESTVLGNTLFHTKSDNSVSEGRILIHDVSDPSAPTQLAEIVVNGQPRAMTVVPRFTYNGLNGNPTFPPEQGLAGEDPSDPGAMLFVLSYRTFPFELGLDGAFLQFYDVTDPAAPVQVGAAVRVSFQSIGTRIQVANRRAFIKLAGSPNPGLAVVDLSMALTRATLLPPGNSRVAPDGSQTPNIAPLVDADGSASTVPDFDGIDLNQDGDFGDPGDRLPDIGENTPIVRGRLVTPGDQTHFVASGDGNFVFFADGMPADINESSDTEPNTGEMGPFYGVGGVGPSGELAADASGGLVIANVNPLFEFPLLDFNPRDGLDDRITARMTTPTVETTTGSTRVHLMEQTPVRERFLTLVDTEEVQRERVTIRDLAFVSNAFDGTVTAIDVTDRQRPQRLAVVQMPPFEGAPLQPVDMTSEGSIVYVDVSGWGTVTIDVNRLVFIDETGLDPQIVRILPAENDANGDGIDDRLAGVLEGVVGNGDFTATGHSYGGQLGSEVIHRYALPRLEIVRFSGTEAELAQFDPTDPGDGDNEELLQRLVPVDFVRTARLHHPEAIGGQTLGDRVDPQFVYFVRTRMPADAGVDGEVEFTLENLNFADRIIPAAGYAFPAASMGSPGCPVALLPKLHRQLEEAVIDGMEGQRLSDLGTTWVSEPFILVAEPFDEPDLDPTSTHILWAGQKLRASLAAAALSSNLGQMYAPTATQTIDLEEILKRAQVTVPTSFQAMYVDSPNPNPVNAPSLGIGEAGGDVHLHSGEFTLESTDLAIKGRLIHYQFQRRYENQSFYNGPLGRGWDFNYNQRLVQISDRAPLDYSLILVDRPDPEPDVRAQRGDVLRQSGLGRVDLYELVGPGADPDDPDELLVQLGLDSDARVRRHYKSPPGFFNKLLQLQDGSFILIEPDGMQYRYGIRGQLTSIEDLNGNRQDFVYDTKGRLRQVVDSMGRVIRFGWYKRKLALDETDFVPGLDEDDPLCEHLGKIRRQVDFIGREVLYEYDGRNNLVQAFLPEVAHSNDGSDRFEGTDRKRLTYGYGSDQLAGNPRFSFPLETMTDPRENASGGTARIRNSDYQDGKLMSQFWGDGSQQSVFSYNGPSTTVTDRNGGVTTYEHDAAGHAQAIREIVSVSGTLETNITYNDDGLPLVVTRPEGNEIEYVYDGNNARRRSQGNVLMVKRRAGGRPTGGSSSELTTEYQSYDPIFNRYTRFVDPGGFETTFHYDAAGNLEVTSQPEGITTVMAHNSHGQVISVTDPEGNLTTHDYHPEATPDGSHDTPIPATRTQGLDASTGGYLWQTTLDPSSGGNLGADGSPAPGPSRNGAAIVTKFGYGPTGGHPDIGYAGNVTSIRDGRGVLTEYAVNELNQVFRILRAADVSIGSSGSALDYVERIFYDQNNRVARRQVQHDDSGAFTEYAYTYDLLDQVLSERIDAGGTSGQVIETTYQYDDNQNLLLTTLSEGNTVERTYDERDRPLSVKRGPGTPSETVYTYDRNDNVVEVRDGRGNTSTTEFDGYDRPFRMTDRVGTTATTYTYDDNSLVTDLAVRGPPGGAGAATDLRRIHYEYDEVYRRVLERREILGDPAGGAGADGFDETRFQYDRNGRVIAVEDDNDIPGDPNPSMLHWYDGANRRMASRDEAGNEIRYFHDTGQNVVQIDELEMPAGLTFTSTARFDALSRMVERVDPAMNLTQMAYDARDNLICTLDAEGNLVHHEYDLVDRRERTVVSLGEGGACPGPPVSPTITTTYTYDENRNLTSITDDNGNLTGFQYDDLDRRTVTTYPEPTPTTTVAGYDANDNVASFTDQNGTLQTNTYDENDRLIQRVVAPGPGLAALAAALPDRFPTLETYEYDGLNRMTAARDEDSRVDMRWDSLDRVTRETQEWIVAPTGTRVVQRQFDGVGNQLRVDYPSGLSIHYGYAADDPDRIISVGTAPGAVDIAEFQYTGPVRVDDRAMGNGVTLSFEYDADRRPVRMLHQGPLVSGRNTLFDLRFGWSAEDQRVAEQRMHKGGYADLFPHDRTFRVTGFRSDARLVTGTPALDLQGQLPASGVAAASVEEPGYERVHTYDGAFNHLTAGLVGSPGAPVVPSFPDTFDRSDPSNFARNQYTEVVEDGLARTQTYDPNGNTTGLRLERRSDTTHMPVFGEAAVEYDYRNQPLRITYAGTGDSALYRYDALGRRIEKLTSLGAVSETTQYVCDASQEIEEIDGSGNTRARYVFGSGVDEVLAFDRADPTFTSFDRYFYHENSLGSIVGLSDASGAEVEHYRYDAFGTPIIESAEYVEPLVHEIRDVGTGLEIDFTEPMHPEIPAGRIEVDGVPVPVELVATSISVPGAPTAQFRATYRASVSPVPPGATVEILAPAGADAVRDLSGNAVTVAFAGTVSGPTGASYTGPDLRGYSAVGNPFLFQGRRYDAETGLYYYRSRYYSPSTGRFLQNDPKGYADGPNLYAAFANNPLNLTDPMGTQAEPEKQEQKEPEKKTSWFGWLVGKGAEKAKGAATKKVSEHSLVDIEKSPLGKGMVHIGETQGKVGGVIDKATFIFELKSDLDKSEGGDPVIAAQMTTKYLKKVGSMSGPAASFVGGVAELPEQAAEFGQKIKSKHHARMRAAHDTNVGVRRKPEEEPKPEKKPMPKEFWDCEKRTGDATQCLQHVPDDDGKTPAQKKKKEKGFFETLFGGDDDEQEKETETADEGSENAEEPAE